MAPAAAHLAAGVPIGALGPDVDPVLLTPALVPLPSVDDDGRIAAEVLWVDRYGNCQLNLAPEQLEDAGAKVGDALELTVVDVSGVQSGRRARWVRTFADAKPSELVVLVDSYGMCTIALDRRSAAVELGAHASSPVTVSTEGGEVDRGVPIGLGRKEARAREGRDELGPCRVAGADPRRVDRAVRVPALAEPAKRQRVRGPAAVRTLWGGLGGYVA